MRKFLSVVALVLVSATAASAQTVHMKLTGTGSISDGQYKVGPYSGLMDGQPITLNCVDFFHSVAVGQEWEAVVSPLSGDLSQTRQGNAGLSLYEQAAYLTTKYAGASNTDVIDIQHAIWRLFGADNPLVDGGNSSFWLADASAHYGNYSYNSFEVITAVDPNSVQEFITSTPEPSSMALLGTGLVGLVPLVRRRNKRS